MSRYSDTEYFNHEGYKDITVYKALQNIKRRGRSVVKIRIMFRRDKKEDLDMIIEKLGKDFNIINKSSIYENTRSNKKYSRVYLEIEEK